MKEQKAHHNASKLRRATTLGLVALAPLMAGFQSACTAYQPATKNAVRHFDQPVHHSPAQVNTFENPVIFLHGTMGSHLVDAKSGRVVWGQFSADAANDYTPAALRGLALPMKRGGSLAALHDDTFPSSNLNRVSLSVARGVRLNIGFYDSAMKRLRKAANGMPTEAGAGRATTCNRFIEFSYDWRRSCDENAACLARFIEAKKAEFVEKHGYPKSMKFDFIAHSQGALILRYYLRYGDQLLPRDGSLPNVTWEGAPHVQDVALLGAPNAGIPVILKHLTEGHRAKPFFPKYEAAVVGTSPSVYQMLPRARDGVLLEPGTSTALDPLEFEVWVRKEWGLANPEQDKALRILLPHVASADQRRAIALDHLRKCLAKAAQFQAALDRPAHKPRHLHVTLYGGDAVKTPLSYFATPRKVTLHRSGVGDVMVPLSSALRCAADGAFVFHCSHNGLACRKNVNHHVFARLLNEK